MTTKTDTVEKTTVAKRIAELCEWLRNVRSSDKYSAANEHRIERELLALARHLPSGSGIDCGTKIEEESGKTKIVLSCEFHHMDDGGYYDGWTSHTINVIPTFSGIEIKSISGRNRNDIKDYLAEVYSIALNEEIEITSTWEDADTYEQRIATMEFEVNSATTKQSAEDVIRSLI